MPYGKAYVSYPESVMADCDCGERQVLTASEAVCRCGADHTTLVREERVSDGGTHPWDEEYGQAGNNRRDRLCPAHWYSYA